MTDREALLRAVLADPDDDAPRLVLADHFDEVEPLDHERAEFIRVGCELARHFGEPCPDGRRPIIGPVTNERLGDLRRREAELLGRYAARWAKPWDGIFSAGLRATGTEGTPVGFARGFIETITCPAADWLAHADAILSLHPVRRVTLTTWPTPAEMEETLRRPTAKGFASSLGVVELAIVGGLDGERAARFLNQFWPGVTFDLPIDYDTILLARGSLLTLPADRGVVRNNFAYLTEPPA